MLSTPLPAPIIHLTYLFLYIPLYFPLNTNALFPKLVIKNNYCILRFNLIFEPVGHRDVRIVRLEKEHY